jgi:hypothetical protein
MKSPLSYLPLASGFLVLVLSLAIGVLTVTSKNTLVSPSQNMSTKAAQETGSLSLSPATGDYSFAAGTSYPVGIIVSSGEKSLDGVDIIINFDPKMAQVVGKVTTANLFEQYMVNSIDNVSGQIKLGALTFTPKPVTGVVGTFKFTPLKPGTVDFTFVFTPGSTTDTNLAETKTARDVLGSVENASYVFK